MNTPLPYETHCPQLASLLPQIIDDDARHARWLNTLSMMESVGARKIAGYVDPIHVDELTLQHASEEARHAHYLKRQISKIGQKLPDYSAPTLLAPRASYHYLHRLDWTCSRYLKQKGLSGRALKNHSYLYVTYLIEVRAMKLYHTYQAALTDAQSPVHVRSILKEEEGHLSNMTTQLQAIDPDWQAHCHDLQIEEQKLFERWIEQLQSQLHNPMQTTPQ